jgi:hypothetical protein
MISSALNLSKPQYPYTITSSFSFFSLLKKTTILRKRSHPPGTAPQTRPGTPASLLIQPLIIQPQRRLIPTFRRRRQPSSTSTEPTTTNILKLTQTQRRASRRRSRIIRQSPPSSSKRTTKRRPRTPPKARTHPST